MKFCKLKQIGIGTLSLAMGLFFSCSPFAAAEDGGDRTPKFGIRK